MKYLHYILLALMATPAAAQDKLVTYSDVTFHSAFEKAAFQEHFIGNKENYLALFMATTPDVTQESYKKHLLQYNAYLNDLKSKKIIRKKAAKKIKQIYSDVHSSFLNKYEAENHFSSIFSEGYYNCVSASALYSLIFNDLKIPFIIKEMPTHVYVVAFPDTEKIVVEATDPTGGSITMNDRSKTALVKQMKNAKLISEEEFQAKTPEQLFDQYYFSDKDVTLQELIGIQYTNDALYKLAEEEYEIAYQQLEKAYLFYPVDKVISLLASVNLRILQEAKFENINDINYLSKLARFIDDGISREMIINEFLRLNNDILITKGDEETYEKFYAHLITQLNDEDLKKEISYLYHYERARVLYNQGNYVKALPLFAKALVLQPDNLNIQSIFVSALSQMQQFESNYLAVIDRLEQYKKEHPQLLNNNQFKSMLVNAYLVQAGLSYDLGKIEEATAFQKIFEENFTKALNINAINIGRTYAMAAIYYFKKGYTHRARKILAKGLEYAPGNHELLVRQRMIR